MAGVAETSWLSRQHRQVEAFVAARAMFAVWSSACGTRFVALEALEVFGLVTEEVAAVAHLAPVRIGGVHFGTIREHLLGGHQGGQK